MLLGKKLYDKLKAASVYPNKLGYIKTTLEGDNKPAEDDELHEEVVSSVDDATREIPFEAETTSNPADKLNSQEVRFVKRSYKIYRFIRSLAGTRLLMVVIISCVFGLIQFLTNNMIALISTIGNFFSWWKR